MYAFDGVPKFAVFQQHWLFCDLRYDAKPSGRVEEGTFCVQLINLVGLHDKAIQLCHCMQNKILNLLKTAWKL